MQKRRSDGGDLRRPPDKKDLRQRLADGLRHETWEKEFLSVVFRILTLLFCLYLSRQGAPKCHFGQLLRTCAREGIAGFLVFASPKNTAC